MQTYKNYGRLQIVSYCKKSSDQLFTFTELCKNKINHISYINIIQQENLLTYLDVKLAALILKNLH